MCTFDNQCTKIVPIKLNALPTYYGPYQQYWSRPNCNVVRALLTSSMFTFLLSCLPFQLTNKNCKTAKIYTAVYSFSVTFLSMNPRKHCCLPLNKENGKFTKYEKFSIINQFYLYVSRIMTPMLVRYRIQWSMCVCIIERLYSSFLTVCWCYWTFFVCVIV